MPHSQPKKPKPPMPPPRPGMPSPPPRMPAPPGMGPSPDMGPPLGMDDEIMMPPPGLTKKKKKPIEPAGDEEAPADLPKKDPIAEAKRIGWPSPQKIEQSIEEGRASYGKVKSQLQTISREGKVPSDRTKAKSIIVRLDKKFGDKEQEKPEVGAADKEMGTESIY